ncbi:MAG: BNR-4 repeat-containing protein, partial [Phycisphaerae bacterium]|nr:BNR-4 repeat-containing protein [Phycisphaerae bacterium]
MYGINRNRLLGRSVVLAVVLAYAAVPMTMAAGETAEPIVFHHDGGWCWYQDERAIVVDNTLTFGTIANGHNPDGSPNADRRGHIEITSYDLAAGKPIGTFLLHANYQPDDHNSPALLVRGDGRLLAMYCKHHRGAEISYRISTKPGDAMDWQAVKTFAPSEKSQVTYSNLFRLAAERDGKGRVYDFFRGYDNSFEPSWMVSDDEGETWNAGGVLITEPGRERPYAKYASNGTDTIHFVFTDGHPRNCLNSIYHAYYRDGKVHTSDGKVIRALADGPITPAEATRIFEGGKNRVAWTSDLHLDPKGHPVAAYTLHRKPDFENDHRYRYARWDGSQWHDFEIAHAGTWLYEKEADYTGNIAIDPDDVNTVFISTDAHPTSGEPLISTADGQRHYELFRGVTADGGKTWTWTPVTANSPCDNIRPIVPKWNAAKTVVLWLRGKLETYTKYDLDVVGKVFETSAAKVFEPVPDTSGAGFVPLFDGETLDGWRPVNGGAKYHVEDGCVVGVCDPASKMNTFLRT